MQPAKPIAGMNPAIEADQALVLASAPLIFWLLPIFCIRFCRKDCNVGVDTDADAACEALIEFIRFWKLLFKLASGSVELPAAELPVAVLLADNCCNRLCRLAVMFEP